jgi:hypothetical protein
VLNTGLLVLTLLVTVGSIIRFIMAVVRKEQNANKWLLPAVGMGALYVIVVIILSLAGF